MLVGANSARWPHNGAVEVVTRPDSERSAGRAVGGGMPPFAKPLA